MIYNLIIMIKVYSMGIKQLNSFIKKHAPSLIRRTSLSELSGLKVAIDVTIYLYKFKVSSPHNWINNFIYMISALISNNVQFVFVYDGEAPIEKQLEREHRRKTRTKLNQLIHDVDESIHLYSRTGQMSRVLEDFCDRHGVSRHYNMVQIADARRALDKMRNRQVNITDVDIQLTKDLFEVLHIPRIVSPVEAEMMCCYLCREGVVDAVMSDDSDVLAHGAKLMISNVDIHNNECSVTNFGQLIQSLNLTREQFVDFCIMCGTDYNSNIFRVGPEKSYRYISTYKSIDNLPDDINVSILNHHRIRELFNYQSDQDYSTLFDNPIPINIGNLRRFMLQKSIQIPVDCITNALHRRIGNTFIKIAI